VSVSRILLCSLGLVLSASGQNLPSGFLSVPAKLAMEKPTMEVKLGAELKYTLTLKNAQNQPVAAPTDLKIQVTSNRGAVQEITMRRGQSSIQVPWTAKAEGFTELTARSGRLAPASCLVLVIGAARSLAMEESPAAERPVQPQAPGPGGSPGRFRVLRNHRVPALGAPAATVTLPAPEPAAAAPSSPGISGISVYIRPQTVYGDARSLTWQASVAIAAQAANGALVPVASDTIVHLTPNLGQLSASDVTLRHGDASTFNLPVTLTSRQAGTDSIVAESTLGSASAQVIYEPPQPAHLRLAVGAPQFDLVGNSVAKAMVCLEDAGNSVASFADHPLQVRLTSTFGEPPAAVVVVPQNGICSEESKLTSRDAGSAVLTAQSVSGLEPDDAQIIFPAFPWHLVMLALLGGFVGAFVTSFSGVISRRWWSHVWRNLLLGAIFGGISYLFACYGALILPKEVPVNLENIPTVSRVGAFLVGFLGGFLGRKLWKVDDADTDDSHKPQAERAAAGGP